MIGQNRIAIATAGLLSLSTGLAWAQPDAQYEVAQFPPPIVVTLKANDEPDDWDHPGPDYNIFDPNQTDDHAIYHSAADWMRDPDSGLYLNGLVDEVGSFGMNFGNCYYDYPEGYDRQVKHIQEYMLAPAYDAGMTAESLISATLTFVVDRVIDMSLNGLTDAMAPEWMYVHVFAGDGQLTTIQDAQLDFDRCDRKHAETWDLVVHLVSEQGYRLSQDEIDYYGGAITFDIDVTEGVRDLLADQEAFAGFAMAGSHDGDFTLMSMDGGNYPAALLPTLTLVGSPLKKQDRPVRACSASRRPVRGQQSVPAPEHDVGDFNRDGAVDAADLAHFARCLASSADGVAAPCNSADLDKDGDVDKWDLVTFRRLFCE
ncbi:MAG: dockerin type I repeat-containing protein [Phycisphaerae bacterium]